MRFATCLNTCCLPHHASEQVFSFIGKCRHPNSHTLKFAPLHHRGEHWYSYSVLPSVVMLGHRGVEVCMRPRGDGLLHVHAQLSGEEASVWCHQLLLPRDEGHVPRPLASQCSSSVTATTLQWTRYVCLLPGGLSNLVTPFVLEWNQMEKYISVTD